MKIYYLLSYYAYLSKIKSIISFTEIIYILGSVRPLHWLIASMEVKSQIIFILSENIEFNLEHKYNFIIGKTIIAIRQDTPWSHVE